MDSNTVIIDIAQFFLSKPASPTFSNSAWLEYNRYNLVTELRKYFLDALKAYKFAKHKMFARYLWVAKMIEVEALDPVLPNTANSSFTNTVYNSMIEKGIPNDVASDILEDTNRKAAELLERMRAIPDKPIKIGENLTFRNLSFSIFPNFVNKLRNMYKGDSFYNDLFILLARYRSLYDDNQQAAINSKAMEYLTSLGCNVEGFASPLNSTLPTYCSAFPDTDIVWGSQGDFFNVSLEGREDAVYELNPPFIEEIMMATAIRAVELPNDSIIIMPGWEDTPSYAYLSQSERVKRIIKLPANTYTYTSGRQYEDNKEFLSIVDSTVFVLMDITDEEAADLYNSFIKTPSLNMLLNWNGKKMEYEKKSASINTHIGQMKLGVGLIEFLTLYYDGNNGTLVYAGAAPSYNTMVVARMFPKLKFELYDTNTITIPSDLKSRVIWYKSLFGVDTISKYKNSANVYFVSDIRSNIDKASSTVDAENQVAIDMFRQLEWVRLLNPKASLLKCKFPYYTATANSIIRLNTPKYLADVKPLQSNHFRYLAGKLYLQAWSGAKSSELRLVVTDTNAVTDYDINSIESILVYHNSVERPLRNYPHPYNNRVVEGEDIIPGRLRNSFDSWLTLKVLHLYFTRAGVNIPTIEEFNNKAMKVLDAINKEIANVAGSSYKVYTIRELQDNPYLVSAELNQE